MSQRPTKSSSKRRVAIAHAHSGHRAYVFLRAGNRSIFGSVQLPVVDLREVLDLAMPPAPDDSSAASPAVLEPIRGYLESHFSIHIDGREVRYALDESRLIEIEGDLYVSTSYHATGLDLGRPALFRVEFDALVDVLPERETLLIVLNSRGFGRYKSEEERRYEMGAGQTIREFVVQRPTGPQKVTGTLRELQRAVADRLRR